MQSMKSFVCAIVLVSLTSCTGSQILVGPERPPIDPGQVRIYLDPPAQFEKIAVLESNSTASWAFTDQQKSNKAVDRLKERAAALGANGVLLGRVQNQSTGSINTGQLWGNAAGIGFLGGSTNVYMKVGSGLAIYVPPGSGQPAPSPQPQPNPWTAAPTSQPSAPSAPYEQDPAKRCDACARLRVP